jgi:hypothetical protein
MYSKIQSNRTQAPQRAEPVKATPRTPRPASQHQQGLTREELRRIVIELIG